MRRRAWIPNALTLGNLTAGFVSLILSGTGSPEGFRVGAVLILVHSARRRGRPDRPHAQSRQPLGKDWTPLPTVWPSASPRAISPI